MEYNKSKGTPKHKPSYAIVVTLAIVFLVGTVLLLAPISFQQFALAISGNYNRSAIPAEIPLTLTHWNYLDEDFLFKDGSNGMTGDLQMGGNRIYNLTTNSAFGDDAANVNYVDNEISAAAAAGGGDVFTVWGSTNCGTANQLYQGIAFGAEYNQISGGSNPVCIQQPGGGGIAFGGSVSDKIFPVVTGVDSANLPGPITQDRIIRCAVCHDSAGTCYTAFGTPDCNGGIESFATMYSGYALGSASVESNNSTQRYCVNEVFDSTVTAGGQLGAIWEGTIISNAFSLGYSTNRFIRCSVCCN